MDSGLDSVCDEEPGRVQTEHTDLSVHARMSVFCFVTVCVGIIPKVSCLPDKAALLSCGLSPLGSFTFFQGWGRTQDTEYTK